MSNALKRFATANYIISVSKARLTDLIATLSPAQMKAIDKSIATSLELMKYYDAAADKYEKLSKYTAQVKADRNLAQDKMFEIKKIIEEWGFNESSQEKLKKLLDIE